MAFDMTNQSILQVTLRGETPTQVILNVFWYRVTIGNAGNPYGTGDFAFGFNAIVATPLALVLSSLYIGDNIRIREVLEAIPGPPPSNKPVLVFGRDDFQFQNQGVNGGQAGDTLPTYAAASITLRGNRTTSSLTGGKRLGPLVEADTQPGLTPNLLTAAALTRLQTAATAMNQTITMTGEPLNFATPIIWSPTQAALGGPPADLYAYDMSQATARDILGSQLTRKQMRQ